MCDTLLAATLSLARSRDSASPLKPVQCSQKTRRANTPFLRPSSFPREIPVIKPSIRSLSRWSERAKRRRIRALAYSPRLIDRSALPYTSVLQNEDATIARSLRHRLFEEFRVVLSIDRIVTGILSCSLSRSQDGSFRNANSVLDHSVRYSPAREK